MQTRTISRITSLVLALFFLSSTGSAGNRHLLGHGPGLHGHPP